MEWKLAKHIAQFGRVHRVKKAARLVSQGEGRLLNGTVEDDSESVEKSLSRMHKRLARALMPGKFYLDVISDFLKFKPESWVEIGVGAGRSLALLKPPTRAIGIDPNPNVSVELSAKIYNMPSDEFFASHNLLEELGVSRLGLAFIDGLHLFEQVLRDFINLERNSDKETIILIHDCLPITSLVASRTRSTVFWCGDVWKIVAVLLECRPDLKVFMIPAAPSGLTVVTNLDPKSNVLVNEYDRILDKYGNLELEYDVLDTKIFEKLRMRHVIIPNEWKYIIRNVMN